MGLFDFLPCCGRRSVEDDKHDQVTEADPLLAPGGAESITSQEGYGATSMSAGDGGLSGEQRERIAEIGRQVGNHMLPINHASRGSIRQVSAPRPPSPDSTSSPSRPTTPSLAPAADPDSLAAADADGDDGHSTIASRSGAATPTSAVPDADGVVHKQLFHASAGGNGAKRGGGGRGGKKTGRGRGRGRSKKMK